MKTTSTYNISIEYSIPSSRENKFRTFEIEATSPQSARTKARHKFRDDWRHRTARIIKVLHTGGTVPCKPVVIARQVTVCCPPQVPTQVGTQLRAPRGPLAGRLIQIVARFKSLTGHTILAVEEVDGHSSATVRETKFLGDWMQPVRSTEYWTVYPNGNVYKQDQPLRNSMYGFEDLVRIKVQKVNGKIVSKEFL